MIRLLLLAAMISAVAPSRAAASDLTLEDVRALVAAMGFNPGTSRLFGNRGVQTLTNVDVDKGEKRGEFVIRVRILGPKAARRHHSAEAIPPH
jgi:hypothetical protein